MKLQIKIKCRLHPFGKKNTWKKEETKPMFGKVAKDLIGYWLFVKYHYHELWPFFELDKHPTHHLIIRL